MDPFIIGVYAGDPDYLIPKYALPKLYNLEATYGSFIKGSMKIAKERKKDPRWANVTRQIFSYEGGLSELTNTLYKKSGTDNFVLGATHVKIETKDNRFTIRYKNGGNEFIVTCNKVITTSGAHTLKEMLPFLTEKDLNPITKLKYAKVIEASIGFNNWNGFNLDGFGGLIPHKEKRNILGILFLSAFLKNRAPEKGALLTIFTGGTRNEELLDLQDSKIENIIEEEIKDLMQINSFKPDLFEFKRYDYAIPQYGIDTGERLKKINELQNKYPGLILAGNIRDGIGMADRIKQGRTISDKLTGEEKWQ